MRGQDCNISSFYHYLNYKTVAVELRRKLKYEQPDIIHIFGRLADNLYRVLPLDRTVFHHATEGKRDAGWEQWEVDSFRKFAGKIAKNFAPGKGVSDNVSRDFGITRKIDIIYTICPDEAGPDIVERKNSEIRKTIRFGILCRFTSEKGIEYLIKAIEMFMAKHAHIDFVFAGQGALAGMINDFITVSGSSSIRIAEVHKPADILKNIDVFVHPSITDAMPMAIAEAMMCGCPCIATPVGGIPDLVRNGIEGFIVPAADPHAIFRAMDLFAMMSPEELARYRMNARARYEECCLPVKVGDVVEQHYKDILSSSCDKA